MGWEGLRLAMLVARITSWGIVFALVLGIIAALLFVPGDNDDQLH